MSQQRRGLVRCGETTLVALSGTSAVAIGLLFGGIGLLLAIQAAPAVTTLGLNFLWQQS